MENNMNTKLTLTIDRQVIQKAKQYAKKEGRSLSDLVENYLQSITHNEDANNAPVTPIVKSLKGSFKNFSGEEKNILTDELSKKYLENG